MGSVDRTDDPEPATTPGDAERGKRAVDRARVALAETVSDDEDDGAPASLRSERYVDGTEIARGGMGRVLVATDTVLGREVALKSLLAAADPDSVRRFERETRITALLEHPSIVPVYDAGRLENGAPFIAMRKVSGQPLEKLVRSAGTLAERLALVSHIVDAANAVAHAHARGVLHRDLKPANILVGEHGETVVIDWGLAKIVPDLAEGVDEDDDLSQANRLTPDGSLRTHAGAVFGTPGFMSPEQLAGERADRRSDVFALGATLYHVLAQQPPHYDPSAEVMMSRGAQGAPPPIAKVVAGVPRDLASIVDKALAFRPDDRYADATSLAADLRRFLTGQLVAARQYSLRERATRFVHRNRLLVAALAVALVVAVVAFVRVAQEKELTANALKDATVHQRETDEALQQTTLMHARALLWTNPTAAIAVVKPLASGVHWREVRDIAAAAHAGGACFGLPGPVAMATQIVVSGARAAAIDTDGRVWLYDLEKHAAHELPPVLPAPHRTARHLLYAGERLIAWDATRLVSVDEAGAHELAAPLTGNIVHVSGTEEKLFVTTDDGHLTRLDPVTEYREVIATPGAFSAQPSPDGRRLAIATVDGLYLAPIDTREVQQRVGRGRTRDVMWDTDSRLLAAVQAGDAILVEDGAAPRVLALYPDVVGQIAISSGRIFIRGLARLVRMGRDGVPVELGFGWEQGLGVGFLRDGSLVGANADGTIEIAFPVPGSVALRTPTDHLGRIAAGPSGPYVVAVSAGRVFAWNVEDLVPRAQAIDPAQIFVTLGGDRALLGEASQAWRWRDLAKGTERPVPGAREARLMRAIADPAGSTAVLFSLAGNRVFAARYDDARLYEIEGDVEYVLAHDVLAVGDRAGRVVEIDLHGPPVLRVEHGSPVRAIAERAGWQAVLWADGAVWRRRAGDTGPGERGQLPALPYIDGLHVASTGRVCGTGGQAVACWGPDGASVRVALPFAATFAASLDDTRVLVVLADGSLVRVDIADGQLVTVVSGGVGYITLSEQIGLGVARLNDRKVVAIDFIANIWWPLANGNFVMPAIAQDAPTVRALVENRAIVTWNLALPANAEATERWLDRLTNAAWIDQRLVWK